MGHKVGIFGSRKATPEMLEQCSEYVRKLYLSYPHVLVVSGGAEGIDSQAEGEAIHQGGQVVSFRPVARGSYYEIEVWLLGRDSRIVPLDHFAKGRYAGWPTWGNKRSALLARDFLIADYADRGVCWHHGNSPGTRLTRALFVDMDKQITVYE